MIKKENKYHTKRCLTKRNILYRKWLGRTKVIICELQKDLEKQESMYEAKIEELYHEIQMLEEELEESRMMEYRGDW